jgi:small subunit ribosomal protein S2
MKELLEAGVHFGHQVRRWNPKMKEYIFGERNGIYIIDLQKTQKLFRDALNFVTGAVAEKPNMKILFVGTKRQAQEAIKEEAERAGQYYINNRWLGGLLTNYQTVQNSIQKLKNIEAMKEDGRYEMLTKKERLGLDRQQEGLMKNLAGIKDMKGLPDMLFIIDVRKEEIAVAEANRLGIPVVAVVDTNCSPEGVDHVIPGNDDALRAIRLFAARIADAILEGQNFGTEGGVALTTGEGETEEETVDLADIQVADKSWDSAEATHSETEENVGTGASEGGAFGTEELKGRTEIEKMSSEDLTPLTSELPDEQSQTVGKTEEETNEAAAS